MIKFFRKIRQNLLMENKTGKYFKYAIGEIVLVVIGILIALQINNWNENRKNRIEETRALENIQRDFKKNKELILDVMKSTETIFKSGIEILNYTGNKQKPATEDDFNALLNNLFNSAPYYPQNGFLDDLLSSGKLGIFNNVELRNLLSSWKPEVEILDERFKSVDENEARLNTFILKSASWLNADQSFSQGRNVKFPKSGFEIDNRNMLNILHFENLVENLVISADNHYSAQKKTEKLLDKIIVVIENETATKQ